MIFWGPDDVNTDVHVIRATDAIMGRMLTTPGKNDQQLLRTIERGMLTPENIVASKVPYAVYRILDPSPSKVNTSQGGLIIERYTVESVVSVIFAVAKRDGQGKVDAQAVGEGARDAILIHLDAWDRIAETPLFWNFSDDMKFSTRLTKGVSDPIVVKQVADPLYTIPIQFKIWVQRTVPLT